MEAVLLRKIMLCQLVLLLILQESKDEMESVSLSCKKRMMSILLAYFSTVTILLNSLMALLIMIPPITMPAPTLI